jgi:Protein of unknown function (DUF3433)
MRAGNQRALMAVDNVTSNLRSQNRTIVKYSEVRTAEVHHAAASVVKHTRQPPLEHWRPIWLRKRTLCCFYALFLSLCLSLGIMSYLNHRFDGFPLTLTSNHYAWTYGPTAILVVIVSLWRQADYCCKVNQPWQELSRGASPATESVLLDYMWPLQITSFRRALKNRHGAVASTIAAFALLKVVVVVSTTLLYPADSFFSPNVQITLWTKFEAANFWAVVAPTSQFTGSVDGPQVYTLGSQFGDVTYGNMTSDPVWDLLNLQNQYNSQDVPVYMSTAFTNFSLASNVPGTVDTIAAEVDVFEPNATCEIAAVSWPDEFRGVNGYLDLETPTCTMRNITINACSPFAGGERGCAPSSQAFVVQRFNCAGDGGNDDVDVNAETLNTYQYAIIAAEFTLQNGLVSNDTSLQYDIAVMRATAVSCRLTYTITKRLIRGTGTDSRVIDSISAASEPAASKIANLTDLQLSEVAFSSLQSANSAFDSDYLVPDSMGASALLHLMLTSYTADTPSDRIMEASTMQTLGQDILEGLSNQLMRRYFLAPDNAIALGSADSREQRLRIRPAALWVMVASFATLSLLVLVVIWMLQQNIAPKSPATLASNAAILSRSPTLHAILRSSGKKRLSQIRRELAEMLFVVDVARGLSIRVSAKPAAEKAKPQARGWPSKLWTSFKPNKNKKKSEHPGWGSKLRSMFKMKSKKSEAKQKREWMPYSARRHAIALTLVLPIIATACLEILWHFSQHDDGFVKVSSDNSVDVYALRYSSTVIVLIIATFFNSLDFAIATLTPFSVLRSGCATSRRTMLFAILGDLPPVALYKAVRHRHFGAALSNAASSIGSVLTIIASGLWVMDNLVTIEKDATAAVGNVWNISWEASNVADNGATTLFNSIQHGSTDGSQLIWQNTVLPQIQDVKLVDHNMEKYMATINTSSLRYSFDVTVLRPVLECQVLPSSALQINQSFNSGLPGLGAVITSMNNFAATAKLPTGCIANSDPGSDTISFLTQFDANRDEAINWIGKLHELNVTGSSTAVNGCPSLGAFFGSYGSDTLNDPVTYNNITTLLCYQRLQEVQVNIPFTGNPSSPSANFTGSPLVDTDRVRTLSDPQTGLISLSYRIVTYTDGYLTGFQNRVNERFDSFFNHLTWGPNGTSHEAMLGPNNSDTLISAMNNLYQKYMVHVIDLNFRSNSAATATARKRALSDQSVTGVATAFASRLKINRASKLTLQIMLAVMTVLGALAYWLVGLRGMIPRDPCSIASTMAFFAGSRLCGREILAEDDKAWREQMRDEIFSLGWWDVKDEDEGVSEEEGLEQVTGESRMMRREVLDTEAGSERSVKEKRFGIDVGVADQLGFSEKGEWRKRIPRSSNRAARSC